LSEVVDVNGLPKELILGIPEEVIERNPTGEPIFSQLCRGAEEGLDLFVLSVVCGTDESERPAYLTLVEFLAPGSPPALLLPVDGLPEQERSTVLKLRQRVSVVEDIWVKNVKRMLRKASRSGYRNLASVRLVRAVFPPEWTPGRQRVIVVGMLIFAGIVFVLLALLIGDHLSK
jgi:hypothetical protein